MASESNEKEQALASLLRERPDISMREANVILKERFGSGVWGAVFAKVRRSLTQADSEDAGPDKTEKPETRESTPAAPLAPEPVAQVERRTQEEEPRKQPVTYSVPRQEQQPVKPKGPTHPVRVEVKIPEAETVHLAGTFNAWNIREFPLKPEGRGVWVFDGELPEGEHTFKFVVDGNRWHLDFDRERKTDSTGVSHPIRVP